jgi:hypothetical protein
MIRPFTKVFSFIVPLLVSLELQAQTTITQWNFNSNPPDASTSTGSTIASTGLGTVSAIGGTTSSFASGSANLGSSDPATTDNTGWGITTFPAASAANKTGGIQFNVSTAGYQDIQVSFDLRHSSTASRYEQLQYTLDASATTPVWVDFGAAGDGNAGDTWFNNRSFNLTSVTGLNNNANAAFRVVSTFNAGTSYSPSNSTSTYATSGTWRFDMVTVKGTSGTPVDVTPPVAQVYKTTSNTTSYIKFSEALSVASATNTANYVFNPALAVSNATLSASGDTVYLTHAAITDGLPYNLTVVNVQDLAANPMASTNFSLLFNGSLPNLVITEIAHSPNTMEFIEVYNAGTTSVNLNGLIWTDGTTGDFPNLTLAAGANILFSTNPTSSAALMGGTYYTINSGLGASTDVLIIRNSLNQVVDSVEYFVGTNSWPAAPASAPYGYSFELNAATNNNAIGSNWSVPMNVISSSSGPIIATPGVYPPPAVNPAPQVTSFKQTSATSAYVVFNQAVVSSSATTLSKYSFSPSLSVSNATINAGNDTVTLTFAAMPNGVAHILTVSGVVNASNVPNTTANLNLIWNQSLPNLVITEIIHSPNEVEMIEVYNAGTTSINLGGLIWANGTTGNFPVTALSAGATAVFATAPVTASAILNVAPVYTINNGLGSSNDILVIKNSLGQNVDSVEYFVGTNGWPTAPTGQYSYSFELTAATADNSIGANWIAPQNPVTPQPTQGVITATPGVYPTPPYTPITTSVSFVGGTKVSVNETTATVNIIAKLNGNNAAAASVDLQVLPISTATSGQDYMAPATMQFSWLPNANGANDTLTFTINNDLLPENAEYFIVRMINPVNITLPATNVNHFTVFINDNDMQAPAATNQLTLSHLSSFNNGTSGVNSAEIVAHDPVSQRLFIANSIGAKIDIVNFRNPSAATLINSISVTPYGNINSIAVKNGIVAAAIENAIPEQPGKVVFFDTNGVYISQVSVGAMPDMITFNNAGTKVLTANEGQPNNAYTVDPEGSVSIVDITSGVASVTQANVATATFTSFNSQITALRAAGIRIFGPGATVAQDMEPEYIAISANDQTAWVTCQENNAFAVIDLTTNTVTQLLPLGKKDHSLAANSLDVSDQGTEIQLANWPVKGIYMPDAIAQYTVGGQTYLVTANEGDAREYSGLDETGRVGDATYVLDSATFPYRDALKANIGRLNITRASGDLDGDGDYDEIHAYGGRSISIWNATTGALVWDSGNELELITSKHPVYAAIFNASNANNTLKNRSDDKGPEPEGVIIASMGGKTYAFIALERIGGCMVYNITNPSAPAYVTYINTRTLTSYGGDNGAEGIIFIDSSKSPNGLPIVILANEVSSTLSFFQVGDNVPLSIDMDGVAAYNSGNKNEIVWNTIAEEKGDEFEIQRSKDGFSFKEIGTVKAKGKSSKYVFVDENPVVGTNYYRIAIKNMNGTIYYTKTVTAIMDSKAHETVLYPNPATNVLYLMNNDHSEGGIAIYDINGLLVKKQSLHAELNVLDIQILSRGTYMVKYPQNGQTKTVKFIKQ